MKEKILALLIAKFSGVRKDGLIHLASTLALQVATEEEAQALVDKFDQSKVTEFIKEYRSGVDKEIATANKTTEEKLKEKFDFVEKGKGGANPTKTETKEGGENKDTPPDWALEILNEFKELKGEKITNTRTNQFNDIIKNVSEKQKGILQKNFGRMQFKDDADFAAYLEEIKPEIEAIVAEESARGATYGRPLGGGKATDSEPSDKEIEELSGAL